MGKSSPVLLQHAPTQQTLHSMVSSSSAPLQHAATQCATRHSSAQSDKVELAPVPAQSMQRGESTISDQWSDQSDIGLVPLSDHEDAPDEGLSH